MATRLPSLRSIETFLCVSDVLNFRLASERLHVTVSAISHRIQVLEQELGVQLLDRSRRRLCLTVEGEALLQRLRPGVRMLQDATSLTRVRPDRLLLRIAAPQIFHAWLLSVLGDFQKMHASVHYELQSTGGRRAAGADIAILLMNTLTKREGVQSLTPVDLSPVCSPSFRDAHRLETPQDLLQVSLIDCVPSLRGWHEWFLAAGVDSEVPAPALAVDNHTLLYAAAINGYGVAMGMRSLVAGYLAQGQLVELFPVTVQLGTLGFRINENGNSRLARQFADWLSDLLQGQVQGFSTAVAKN